MDLYRVEIAAKLLWSFCDGNSKSIVTNFSSEAEHSLVWKHFTDIHVYMQAHVMSRPTAGGRSGGGGELEARGLTLTEYQMYMRTSKHLQSGTHCIQDKTTISFVSSFISAALGSISTFSKSYNTSMDGW